MQIKSFSLKVSLTQIALITAVVTPMLMPPLATAQTARLTVDANSSGIAVSPTMHGLFFEDVNYGADGGLYAELVQNRSFEHRDHLFSWSTVSRNGQGEVNLASAAPLNARNPYFVRLQVRAAGQGFGVANTGFDGIAVKQREGYRFSVHARGDATFRGPLLAILEDQQGRNIGQYRINGITPQWKKFEGVIRSTATTDKARLVVLALGTGQVDLDMISLFPQNTWKQRRNGLRADLVQTLANMRPGFMRFPGGCIVEGRDLANAYRWKDTIGDVAERPQNWNRWQDPRQSGPTSQYYQTYGLGFYEYFLLCEDIGAEPVPVINAGMACQFQTGELVPLDQLGLWVQDALDLIEFANGPVTSRWGAKRAAMGHPRPFNMKYLAVGNEQWGEQYFQRYKIFYDAIKAKYPTIDVISTSGPGVDDNWWNLAWGKFKTGTPAQIVDEHYYRPPNWFLEHNHRYDGYDRKGPKVFAGEFAAHGSGKRNNLEAAIAEAAFMTGLVRNADVVQMASYAPLFAKAGATQWTPDLIWFDNARVYGSPSYYVQSMFSNNRPDVVFPVQIGATQPEAQIYRGMIGVATWNTQAEFKDIKVTKGNQTLLASNFSKGIGNWKTTGGKWEVVDGALRQSAEGTNMRALVGDPTWHDYTLSLKARKISGQEGFLIIFQSPGDDTVSWWNLGGWNNTEHGIEAPGVPVERLRGSIETNRWYDIRIELQGPAIKCYLDGQLIQQATRKPVPSLFASAGRDRKTGETILQVVNVSGNPVETAVDLRGVRAVATNAKAVVLASASPNDENSFENPTKVVPREGMVRIMGPNFRYMFPAKSVTMLRVKTVR